MSVKERWQQTSAGVQTLLLGAAVFGSLAALGLGYGAVEMQRDVIHPGVQVESTRLGGMTVQEAKTLLEKTYGKERGELTLTAGEETITRPIAFFGQSYDVDRLAQNAYELGRGNGFGENLKEILFALLGGEDLDVPIKTDRDQLLTGIGSLADAYYRPTENAALSYDGETVHIADDVPGRYLDMEELKETLLKRNADETEISLPLYTVDAPIQKEAFAKINALLGSFTTDYSSSESGRKHNVALGAEKISGHLLQPGESASFNEWVGEISKATGFRDAGVIVNGEFDRGVGGGICQVSTTLYNALVRADVSIVERHNHSRPVHYVKKGIDAAVMRGYKDLKFQNDLAAPIYIQGLTDGNDITFQIFGDGTGRDTTTELEPVRLGVTEPKTIRIATSSLPEGEVKVESSGNSGYSYATYRVVKRGEEVVSREFMNHSYYVAKDRVVRVGTGSSKSEESEKTKKSSEKSSSKKERH